MSIKRVLTPPARSASSSSKKRLRADVPNSESSVGMSAALGDDAESFQDMWDDPPEVSRHAWAVTRCLDDHGNRTTRWSPAHFVAVTMWYGGITAGIQAAKAIRIFGIWSPHVEGQHDGRPPVDDDSDKSHIPDKLWPTTPVKRSLLLVWAKQSTGIPFPDFASAHHHLLRECIGPDLTRFPTVVRPKMKFGQYWGGLVDEEQFKNTLAPILRKYFDPRVDLDSISRKIVGYGINPTSGQSDFGNSQIAKAGGHCGSYRGTNKEVNLLQTNDNQDDEEDFSDPRATGPGAIKKEESDLSPVNVTKLGRERNNTPNQVLLNMKDPSTCANNLYRKHNDTATYSGRTGVGNGRPSIVGLGPASGIYNMSPTSDVINNALPNVFSQPHPYYNGEPLQAARTSYQSPYESQPSANSTMGKPAASYLTNQQPDGHDVAQPLSAARLNTAARGESQGLNKQVINHLYEQTCDVPSYRIYSFSQSTSPTPALPNYWKEVWSHRELRRALVCGSKDFLPWPRESSTPVHHRSSYGVFQKDIDKALFQNAEDDLVKIKKFCSSIIID